MNLLWLTLLFLHQGYTSVPVVTVEPGQSVTLTCAFSRRYQSNTWLYWYKQSAGNTLHLILLQQRTTSPQYGRDFSPSKFHLTHSAERSNLTIFSTVQEDEGMYHCAQMDALESMWSGTYLSIKGSARKTSTYTVLQHSAVKDHPADPETLQCSLLSDSENKTCTGEPTVFWFRSTSETSFPDIIYKDAKRSYNCETRSDAQKRCFYNFSKNINSSDSGTYHCAVATCGQILFANEIHIKNGKTNPFNVNVATVVIIICLAISIIGNIVLICFRTKNSQAEQFKECPSSKRRHHFSSKVNNTEDGPDLNYAALHYSRGRTSQEKKREFMTECVYSQVQGSV